MRTTAFVVLLGLTILGIAAPLADAAPTGTCGAGGGVWTSVDAVCARNGSVCVLYVRYSRPGLLCP